MRQHFIAERVEEIDSDFLQYEIDNITPQDKALLQKLYFYKPRIKVTNRNNSILLYVLGLTDEFDPALKRSFLRGGSPPDIDTDISALKRHITVQQILNAWGQDNVASIAAVATFKLRSLVQAVYRVAEWPEEELFEVLKIIPPPLFGKEPTLAELINGDSDKGYPPHLDFPDKYPKLHKILVKLEGMVSHNSIHAAGLVIANKPIWEYVPVTKKTEKIYTPDGDVTLSKLVTEWDKDQIEEYGLLKLDLLGLDTLDVVAACLDLIYKRHDIKIDIWNLPDNDKRVAAILSEGLLSGIFQLETSKAMKDAVLSIKPENIDTLSAILAIVRPGPMDVGWHIEYAKRREDGVWEEKNPPQIAALLKETYGLPIYQEDLMKIFQVAAGFTLKEADAIRRAIGKKKIEYLLPWEGRWAEGCIANNIDLEWARQFWTDIQGFASYCFNKSHSVAYAYLTWATAYLKAYYPIEFYCALATVKSKTMQPKDWSAKAPEYVQEAKLFDCHILPPDVNYSDMDFSIQDNKIYFGLAGIRSFGKKAANSLIQARYRSFTSIQDLIHRVSLDLRTLRALISSGSLDNFGHARKDLLANAKNILDYPKELIAWNKHETERTNREIIRKEYQSKKDALDTLIKNAKQVVKEANRKKNPGRSPSALELELSQVPERLKELLEKEKDSLTLSQEEQNFLSQYHLDRAPTLLRPKEKPQVSTLTLYNAIPISLEDALLQRYYIGCFLGMDIQDFMSFPVNRIADMQEDVGAYGKYVGVITKFKLITTRAKKQIVSGSIEDGTGSAKFVIFAHVYERIMKTLKDFAETEDQLLLLDCKVTEDQLVIQNMKIFHFLGE